jgi:hypothetical protein
MAKPPGISPDPDDERVGTDKAQNETPKKPPGGVPVKNGKSLPPRRE